MTDCGNCRYYVHGWCMRPLLRKRGALQVGVVLRFGQRKGWRASHRLVCGGEMKNLACWTEKE